MTFCFKNVEAVDNPRLKLVVRVLIFSIVDCRASERAKSATFARVFEITIAVERVNELNEGGMLTFKRAVAVDNPILARVWGSFCLRIAIAVAKPRDTTAPA